MAGQVPNTHDLAGLRRGGLEAGLYLHVAGKGAPFRSHSLLQKYPTLVFPREETGHGLRRPGPSELKGPLFPGWVFREEER